MCVNDIDAVRLTMLELLPKCSVGAASRQIPTARLTGLQSALAYMMSVAFPQWGLGCLLPRRVKLTQAVRVELVMLN